VLRYQQVLDPVIPKVVNGGLSLKVKEYGEVRVPGRGIARIDYTAMDLLEINRGDFVEIEGRRRTVTKCWPLSGYRDEGNGIIRIDGLIRNNAGVGIGDTSVIRKIKAVPAEKVVVASLQPVPPIDQRYLANALVPLVKGENIMVPYYGGRLTYRITDTTPNDIVIVTQKRTFHISTKSYISKEEWDKQKKPFNREEWK
jgi:transitional endoplasmic reticulum ATPase